MSTVSASVQYGDFVGEAKTDKSDHDDVYAFAKSKGIGGMPVAIEFYSGDEGDYQNLAIYTAVNAASFNDIEAEAKANGGTLKVKRHDIANANVADLLGMFKRFSVVLPYRYPSVTEMEYDSP